MQEMILSERFRECCRINIRKRGFRKRIEAQGLSEEDFIDIVVSYAWRCENSEISLSTISDNWVQWSMSRIRLKKLPELNKTGYLHRGFDDVDNKEIAEKLLASPSVTPKGRIAIKKRFFEGKTLEQVGREMNLTQERARQILLENINRLKEKESFEP